MCSLVDATAAAAMQLPEIAKVIVKQHSQAI